MDISGNASIDNIELNVSEDSGNLGDDERIKISTEKSENENHIVSNPTIVELNGKYCSHESQPSDTDEDELSASSSGTPASFELNRKPNSSLLILNIKNFHMKLFREE